MPKPQFLLRPSSRVNTFPEWQGGSWGGWQSEHIWSPYQDLLFGSIWNILELCLMIYLSYILYIYIYNKWYNYIYTVCIYIYIKWNMYIYIYIYNGTYIYIFIYIERFVRIYEGTSSLWASWGEKIQECHDQAFIEVCKALIRASLRLDLSRGNQKPTDPGPSQMPQDSSSLSSTVYQTCSKNILTGSPCQFYLWCSTSELLLVARSSST